MKPMEERLDAGNGKFRFSLQREFMLRDLDNEHDKDKELAWVEENAARFSDYFENANQNGQLERRYLRASEEERQELIRTWLLDMRSDTKKAA